MGKSLLRSRVALLLAAVIGFVLFRIGGDLLGVPHPAGFGSSLLQQSSAPLALGITAVLLPIAAGIGWLLGRHKPDAGIFTAAVGLSALSLRGGPGRYVLFQAQSPAIFITLLAEVLILYAMLLACYGLLSLPHRRREPIPLRRAADEPIVVWTALGVNVLCIALLTVILVRTDQKAQVLIGLFLAACIGTGVTRLIVPVRGGVVLWFAPAVVAVIGYALAYADPGNWATGRIDQPLARPMPLDYASAGPAGALIGSWLTSRNWERLRIEAANSAAP